MEILSGGTAPYELLRLVIGTPWYRPSSGWPAGGSSSITIATFDMYSRSSAGSESRASCAHCSKSTSSIAASLPRSIRPLRGMRAGAPRRMVRRVAMAELTDHPSGKPLVLRVEISAESGGTLSVPALEAGLRALAPAPAPARDEELERRAAELERREARLDETERRLNERQAGAEPGPRPKAP